MQVRYTDYRDRPLDERQLRFQADCREGHAAIVSIITCFHAKLMINLQAGTR